MVDRQQDSTGEQHRGEGELERADRNWSELLGELRVYLALTAVLLVADLLKARGAAVVLSAAFGLLTATLWFLPALVRRRP